MREIWSCTFLRLLWFNKLSAGQKNCRVRSRKEKKKEKNADADKSDYGHDQTAQGSGAAVT